MNKLFFLTFFLPYLLLAQVEVSLPAVVDVSQKAQYSLYDFVIFKEGKSEDLENFKKVFVSDLTKKGILESIKESGLKIKITFENSFKVIASTQINKSELQRKITNHLTADCNTCIFEIQISKLPFVNNPPMNFRTSDFELARGSFMLPLWDSIQTSRYFVSGSWKTYRKVPVSNKWMGQGYRLTDSDLKEELKEVTFLNDKLVERHNLIGKQIVRSIPANSVITRDLLVVEKLVKKGETVRLLIKDGPFEIEMNAQAEADGLAGDSIKVKTNQKSITAKVISKDKVVSE